MANRNEVQALVFSDVMSILTGMWVTLFFVTVQGYYDDKGYWPYLGPLVVVIGYGIA